MNTSDSWLYHKVAISSRKNAILVVCDRLSKIAYFVITIKKTLAKRLYQGILAIL